MYKIIDFENICFSGVQIEERKIIFYTLGEDASKLSDKTFTVEIKHFNSKVDINRLNFIIIFDSLEMYRWPSALKLKKNI